VAQNPNPAGCNDNEISDTTKTLRQKMNLRNFFCEPYASLTRLGHQRSNATVSNAQQQDGSRYAWGMGHCAHFPSCVHIKAVGCPCMSFGVRQRRRQQPAYLPQSFVIPSKLTDTAD
jgi:hypothetical protein